MLIPVGLTLNHRATRLDTPLSPWSLSWPPAQAQARRVGGAKAIPTNFVFESDRLREAEDQRSESASLRPRAANAPAKVRRIHHSMVGREMMWFRTEAAKTP